MTGALRRLLWPEAVAVLGAAPGNRWVRRILSSLRALGYRGNVFPVTARHDAVEGLRCYPTLRDLPRTVDAAVVASDREAAIEAVRGCAECGVGGVVVLAEGFAEAGPDGRAMQEQLAEAARRYGIALLGPNCQGYINCLQPSALWTADISEPLPPGRVAVISHSGAVGTGLTNSLCVRGVSTTYTISTGNEAVLTTADLIEALAGDPDTRVIAAHLETLRDPQRFFAACDRAEEAGKPVVVLKVGRSAAAREAIQAHTGALAGPDRIIDAQFRRHGIIRARSLDELVEACIACCGRRISTPRLAAFASSGAHVGLLVDAAASTEFSFPEFRPETAASLRAGLPDYRRGEVRNPLDIGSALRGSLDAVADDPGVDAVLFVAQTRRRPTGVMDILTAYLEMAEYLHAHSAKPVIVLSANSDVEPAVCARLAARGIPVLAGIDAGLRALEQAHRHVDRRFAPGLLSNPDGDAVRDAVKTLRRPLAGLAALDFVSSLGIPTVKSVEVASPADAAAAARQLGYPVVLKTGASDVLHKSDTGQVFVSLGSEDEIRKAAPRLTPPILVQPHVAGGVELIVGLEHDPELGACLAVGAGGVLAELMDAVALRALPLGAGEAAEMLDETRVRLLLDGYRGALPADRAALVAVIERVAAMGAAAGSAIRFLDLNPVIATPSGAYVVDARVIPGDGAGGDRR
jgi:acyl-CoA synthetase (NDP forming)